MNDTSTVTKVSRFADILRPQISRVSLHRHHARVPPQLPIELINGHVHREYLARAILQQAIRKSSGRASHVHANSVSRTHAEILERAFQLQPAAAGVTQRLAGHLDERIRRHLRASFINLRAIHADLPGENQSLRALARRRKPLRDEKHVEPFFSWLSLSLGWDATGWAF